MVILEFKIMQNADGFMGLMSCFECMNSFGISIKLWFIYTKKKVVLSLENLNSEDEKNTDGVMRKKLHI